MLVGVVGRDSAGASDGEQTDASFEAQCNQLFRLCAFNTDAHNWDTIATGADMKVVIQPYLPRLHGFVNSTPCPQLITSSTLHIAVQFSCVTLIAM